MASFGSETKQESNTLFDAIVLGERDKARLFAEKELAASSPKELIEKHIIPALDKVGGLYDKKEYYLPQLVASAEAARNGVFAA